MSGTVQMLLPKTLYEFTALGTGAVQEVVFAKAVPVISWLDAVVLLRYHSSAGTPALVSTQKIEVVARTEMPSADDPSVDFVSSTDLAAAKISSSVTAPALTTARVSLSNYSNFGSYLRFFVRGTQSTAGTTLKAYISVDLALKSR